MIWILKLVLWNYSDGDSCFNKSAIQFVTSILVLFWTIRSEKVLQIVFSSLSVGNEENENVTVICKASNPAGVSESSIQVSKVGKYRTE